MAKKPKQESFYESEVLGYFDSNRSLKEPNETLLKLVNDNDLGEFCSYNDSKFSDLKGGEELAALSRDKQVAFVETTTEQLIRIDEIVKRFRDLDFQNYVGSYDSRISSPRLVLSTVLQYLLRKNLPLKHRHACRLAHFIATAGRNNRYEFSYPVAGVVKAIENVHAAEPLKGEAKVAAAKLVEDLRDQSERTEFRKLIQRLESILGAVPEIRLMPGEAWSDRALADLKAMKAPKYAAWASLFSHCQCALQGKPSKKWIESAKLLIKAIGNAEFKKHIGNWLPLVDKPRTAILKYRPELDPNPNLLLVDENADILKGLAWCCSLSEDESNARILTALAISAYRKVPKIGARAIRVGNACVYALGAMPGLAGIAQLAILKVRIKFGTAQIGIEKALVATAARVGMPRDELEEMSVPAYGMECVGSRSETLGDITAKLLVIGRKAELQWFNSEGKQLKTVPKSVKLDHPMELKELKLAAKDIQKMLPAQVARIEQLYVQQKEWTFPTWLERYLDHPLMGTLCRRLIWTFKSGHKTASAIWTGDGFVDSSIKTVDWLDPKTTVRLWHPLDEKKTSRITDWRDWLFENEVRQPFKQAHREVYLLTDAERNTGVYSNRFAAHFLKQHQFNALCGAREWKNTLRLLVDAEFLPAHLVMPTWNLRAEFWVEGAGEEYGIDTNETGTFYYLATDQVRFYALDAAINSAHASGGSYRSQGENVDANQPLQLEDIPALAFSEVMRDVDLFVGVASVGNDPNWSDGGPEGRYREYWNSYSFGDLGATADTRKTVLENLIPRLKIADQCTFTDRFLVVKGEIRTYKIHLGSGNILMEPNDQYLCIVSKQAVAKKADGLFLPFDGDATLSIILSKALLLADDKKIKDATIISQINL